MSSTTMSLSKQTASTTRNAIAYPLRGLATVVTALAANALFYFLASLVVPYDPEFVPLANVGGAVIMTLVAAVVAVLLYAALRRYTRQPARIFKVISVVVFLVTLIPVLTYIPTVPSSSTGQTAILILMHVIAACVIVPMLTSTDRL